MKQESREIKCSCCNKHLFNTSLGISDKERLQVAQEADEKGYIANICWVMNSLGVSIFCNEECKERYIQFHYGTKG